MTCKSIFVTGTGTDIGKTYISGLLVKKIREMNYNCGYYKPVLSGAIKQQNGELLPGDCSFVVNISKLNIPPQKCVSYCFKQAVSPHLAAEINNVTIDKNIIINDYKKRCEEYEYLIVEGAGGITCPINLKNGEKYLLSNLIDDLDLDILLVADGGLGTINSVLLTVEYAQKRNIKIKGIILNNYEKENLMHIDNKKQIEYLTKIPIIATVAKGETNIDIDSKILNQIF